MAAIFTGQHDRLLRQALLAVVLSVVVVVGVIWYYFTPKYTRVGYTPAQPVPFSHAQHVGQIGLNCLYCHTHVDESPHSNVPATQTCLNCHSRIKTDSPLLAEIRTSGQSGEPVHWQQVHKLPEYAYFNHSVHVNRGVSCQSCHGPVNEMPVVQHYHALSMGWCLECHRDPAPHIRPREEVANLEWRPPHGQTARALGETLQEQWNIRPPESCQSCHR